jgi:hypothetical protein
MRVVDTAGADDSIAAAAVPRLQEFLARMPPPPRDEQLELDRSHSAVAAVLLGEVEEGPADTGAAMLGRRNQHPDLSRLVATAICRAAMSSASSDAVVLVAPSLQSPLSAVA